MDASPADRPEARQQARLLRRHRRGGRLCHRRPPEQPARRPLHNGGVAREIQGEAAGQGNLGWVVYSYYRVTLVVGYLVCVDLYLETSSAGRPLLTTNVGTREDEQ